jgi:hypothetical protein
MKPPFHGRRRVGLSSLLAIALGCISSLQATEPPSGTDALIRSLLLTSLPREYENSKHWGQTKPRWDGLHISLDGLRLDTKRRWKEVNHGTWTRYQATLVDPERTLFIQSTNLRPVADRRVAFDVIVDAQLFVTGRLSEWVHGVQLYSFSAEADATVRLVMQCEVGLEFLATHFPPEVRLVPRVTAADLELRQFELRSISDAHGPLVRKLGDGLHDILQDEIRERREKLVSKINRAIAKPGRELRLSLHDFLSEGSGLLFSGQPPVVP